MKGNFLCLMILGGWPLIVLIFFKMQKPRQAMITTFWGAVMFLPMDNLSNFTPLIDYHKLSAASLGAFLGAALFDRERLMSYSFHPVDIPIFICCGCGFVTSVLNGIGAYDGFNVVVNTSLMWGVPYFIGRFYFSDPDGLKLLCRAIFIGGLIYIPFILYELKMSPNLHWMVWGYAQHSFLQTLRGGGYRPMVFMQHGIMVGMWTAMASLTAIWCVYAKTFSGKMRGIPVGLLVFIVSIATIACKSTAATGWLAIGIVFLFVSTKMKTTFFICLLLAIPPAYMITRGSEYWDGQNLVTLISDTIGEERAQSLDFRFQNENILVEKAMERPVFGWGGWDRSRVFNEEGEDISVTDGFWIIILGTKGFVGLLSTTLVMMLPMILLVLKCPPSLWKRPEYAPVAVLPLIVLLFTVDCLLNFMMNPIYIIFAGGVSTMLGIYGIRPIQYPVRARVTTAQDALEPDTKFRSVNICSVLGQRRKELHQISRNRHKTRFGVGALGYQRTRFIQDVSHGITRQLTDKTMLRKR
ncbi:hypothetical protein QUF80_14265 [Desulfococcaceae bacterium HSG8]|nr:hypothetical protein [Desulfococcaceae bacterium HSG8]